MRRRQVKERLQRRSWALSSAEAVLRASWMGPQGPLWGEGQAARRLSTTSADKEQYAFASLLSLSVLPPLRPSLFSQNGWPTFQPYFLASTQYLGAG